MSTELIPATPCHPRKWHIVTASHPSGHRHTLHFHECAFQSVPPSCIDLLILIRDALNDQALPSTDNPAWSIEIQVKTGRIRASYRNPSAILPNTATTWQHFCHIPSLARQVAHLNARTLPWRDKIQCAADAPVPAAYIATI